MNLHTSSKIAIGIIIGALTLLRIANAAVPIANFTQDGTMGVTPFTVMFNDTSTNTPTLWAWNFTNTTGNNTPVTFSTDQNTTYTFGAGNWSIQLYVENGDGGNITPNLTRFITVLSPPPANFNGDFETGDLPDWVNTSTFTGAGANKSVSANVTTSAKYNGTYGGFLTATVDKDNTAYAEISQGNISNSSIGYISLYYKINKSDFVGNPLDHVFDIILTSNNDVDVIIDTIYLANATNWTLYETPRNKIDEAFDNYGETLGENTTLKFRGYFWGDQPSAPQIYEIFIDDIGFLHNQNAIIASFTANPVTARVGEQVQFNDTSTATPTSWFWDFGDGFNSSTLQNPVNTFYSPQSYTISLTATNDLSTNTISQGYIVWDYVGYTEQDLEADAIYTLNLTFRNIVNNTLINNVGIIDSLNQTYTVTNGNFVHSYNYTSLIVYISSSGYTSTGRNYVMDQNRTATVYLTEIAAPTPTSTTGYLHQVSYVAHLVRLRGVDYRGVPLSEMNVTAVGVETSGDWAWITDILGLNLNETPIHNTTMSGQTGDDGAIVFLMVETIKYNITFTLPSLSISESHHLYPKEDSYEYVFWTEPPSVPTSSSLIFINLWNQTNQTDPTYVDLFATYTDTGTTTDNLSFIVETDGNVTVFTQYSITPNSWNISYPVLKERGKSYMWEISGNTTRFEYRVGKAQTVTFEGSPIINIDFGEWNQWVALGMIFIIASLFGRASIKYAAAIVPLMTLFFWRVGFLPSMTPRLVAAAVFLGILFYLRYAEQESDI